MRTPVLFPKIFNHPFTYQSEVSETLSPGDFVKAPFGSNEITGVVWPEEQKTEKIFKLKPVKEKLDVPRMKNSLIEFVNWFRIYNKIS